MSNPAKAKLSIHPTASPTMRRDRHTTRPNFDISFHAGSSSAIGHFLSSTMNPSNACSKCCMQKWKPLRKQRSRGMWKRFTAFLKSTLEDIFRFVCHTVSSPYKPNFSNRRNTQGTYTSASMGGPHPMSSHSLGWLFILLLKASSNPLFWTSSRKLFNLFASLPF